MRTGLTGNGLRGSGEFMDRMPTSWMLGAMALLCGCEPLFGGFSTDNSNNCVVNSALCHQPDQACNPETRECEPALGLSAIDPQASDELGGVTATLSGMNLTADLRVRFGDMDATQVAVASASSMTLTIPPSPTARGPIAIELIHPAGQRLRREGLFRYFSNTHFASATPQALTFTPRFPRAADMNRDGRADIVAADAFGSRAAIFADDGTGGLMAPAFVPCSGRAFSLAVGDVNADGFPDLAISLTGPTPTLEVMLNNGDGTFAAPVVRTTKQTVGGLALEDVDGNGRADLIALDDLVMHVWLTGGDGSVGMTSIDTALPYQSYSTSARLYATDLNRDGHLDVIPINGRDYNFPILMGDGTGNFTDLVGPSLQVAPRNVASADFNGDGRRDLVLSVVSAGQLVLLLQSDSGRFDTPRYLNGAMNVDSVVASDMNGDGTADVLVIGSGAPRGVLSILHGLGNGQFTPARAYTLPTFPSSFLVASLLGAPRPSIFVAHASSAGSGDFYSFLRNDTN